MNFNVVGGIHLPAWDEYFAELLPTQPVFNGKVTYQLVKFNEVVNRIPTELRRSALDVGAHVGLWSRLLSSYFQTVYAFEPIKDYCACWHLNQDHPLRTVLYECALGDRVRQVEMVRELPTFIVTPKKPSLDTSTSSIPMTTLDYWLIANPHVEVDLIKIDVEGFEKAVLTGGERLIKDQKPAIFVEQKKGWPEKHGFKTLDAVKLLESWGATMTYHRSGDYLMQWV